MELAGPFVEIMKCSWIPLNEYIGYIKSHHENVKKLSDGAEDLKARKMYLNDVFSYLPEEQSIGQIRRWILKAEEMEEKATKIEKKAEALKKSLFPRNPIFLYSISKESKKQADMIAQHLQKGEFEKLTMPSLTPAVIEEAAPSIEGQSSVKSTLKNIMAALGNENNRIIGVWGMGGVGKTTIVKILNNQLLTGTQHFFSKVIVAVVSKDVKINCIQDDIASRLGLTLRNDSKRASELSRRLKQEKKFLVIVDDIWENLPLEDIGIPTGNSLKDSKIIITTRKHIVCSKMETQQDIKVDVLGGDESWRLFRQKVGDVVDKPAVYDTARKVLQKCGGLPLAIVTVGTALRGCGDSHVWKHALAQLQDSAPSDIEGMEAEVFSAIKVSYERLRHELQPGFLFCCLHPDDYDIEIDRMIKQWMEEGFLEDAGNMEKTINKGHSWVVELKDSSLLLDGREEGFVRIHDVVSDVGISIASKDEGYRSFVNTAVGLKRLPSSGLKWDEYRRISIMRSKIKELQETGSCCQLQTLMLQENTELERTDGILEGSKMLRVLDLSGTAISQVPESLAKLVNLRVLCLRSCRLLKSWELSPLGSLLQLECLDLSDNVGLKVLPRVIGELCNLRSLDLTRTPHLQVVEQGILPRLTRLEELKMLQSFNMWGYFW